jgi:hypothetical protein
VELKRWGKRTMALVGAGLLVVAVTGIAAANVQGPRGNLPVACHSSETPRLLSFTLDAAASGADSPEEALRLYLAQRPDLAEAAALLSPPQLGEGRHGTTFELRDRAGQPRVEVEVTSLPSGGWAVSGVAECEVVPLELYDEVFG